MTYGIEIVSRILTPVDDNGAFFENFIDEMEGSEYCVFRSLNEGELFLAQIKESYNLFREPDHLLQLYTFQDDSQEYRIGMEMVSKRGVPRDRLRKFHDVVLMRKWKGQDQPVTLGPCGAESMARYIKKSAINFNDQVNQQMPVGSPTGLLRQLIRGNNRG